MRVCDRQRTRSTIADLRKVTGDSLSHRMALIVRQPVLGFIEDHKSRATALQRARARRDRLNTSTAVGVNDFLTQVHAHALGAVLRAEQARKQTHSVTGLVLRHRGDLNPRCRMRNRQRLASRVETSETARAQQLSSRKRSSKRVFTPALHPAQRPATVNKPTPVIHRIPPQQQAQLLVRPLPPLASVRAVRLK